MCYRYAHVSNAHAPEARTDRDWYWIAGVCALLLATLSIPERIPVVDLPMHARVLGIITGHPNSLADVNFEANLLAPYWLFYALALPFTLLFEPYTAAKVTFALCVSSIPLAVAFWLRSLHRRVGLALFSSLVAFGSMVGWGLVGVVVGLPVVAALGGATERMCERSRPSDGALVAGLILAAYFAHAFAWMAGLLLVAWLLILRRPSIRIAWPILLAVLVTTVLAWAYSVGTEPTPYAMLAESQHPTYFSFDLEKFTRLNRLGALFGTGRNLFPLMVLIGLAGLHAALGVFGHPGERRRSGPPFSIRVPAGQSIAEAIREHRTELFLAGLFVGFVVASDKHFLSDRFLFLFGGLVPVGLPVRAWRGTGALLAAATVAIVVSCGLALGDGLRFSAETSCVASLSEQRPRVGRLLALVSDSAPPGFVLPVYDHLGNYILARSRGVASFELAHTGYHAIRVRAPGRPPPYEVMVLHSFPELYRPEIGAAFDTIFTSPAIGRERLLLRSAGQYTEVVCGSFALYERLQLHAAEAEQRP